MCAAYYLIKDGHKVTILDQGTMDNGASYINAGYLTPSHFMPLAAPGVVLQSLKWMFNAKSPLYIKPRLNIAFLKWAWAFQKSATQKNVDASVKIIKDINLLSAELFSEIKKEENFGFQLENKGLLIICRTEKKLTEEKHLAKMGKTEGLSVDFLSASEVMKIEPSISEDIIGAIHYRCDWHTTPSEFMEEMKKFLKLNGATFQPKQKVIDFELENGIISAVKTENELFFADEVVLASGTWSNILSKKLGINIPLEAGKGYSINTRTETGIKIPSILAEAKIAITPMNGFTRFAGTMEIAGINQTINKLRVAAIAEATTKYYPKVALTQSEQNEAKCGLRPVSPDGKPYIGRSRNCGNLIFATGHAMMGWSLGPATGKLVSEIILGKKMSMDIKAFDPDRKF